MALPPRKPNPGVSGPPLGPGAGPVPGGGPMGAGAPPTSGGGQAPPSGGGTQAPFMKPQKLPESQFAQNREVPQIQVETLEDPDTHITAEFCLEQMARVLEELAEKQEDPVWLESHRTLAEQWMGAAQMLLQFKIDRQANAGEAELKQQQLYHQDELHQQTLAQGDQQHLQGMKHQDDMHQQSLKQNDATHQFGLKQKDEVHGFDMKSRTQTADLKFQAQKQRLSAKPSSGSPRSKTSN